MARPRFFIVGHSKSGTTALAKFLDQHPDLFIADPQEPNFFCPSWCGPADGRSAFTERSEGEYLALFAGAGPTQLCGEASAAYLYSPESARLIRDFEPRAKIIMIFREPVSFLRSYHLQMLKNAPAEGETVRDLAEAIRLEGERRRGASLPEGCRIPEMLYYTSDRLAYDVHYDRYADVFPPDQILAGTYDDLRGDNAAFVRRVVEFLGVDPDFEPRLADHNVGGVAVRSRTREQWARRLSHGGGLTARMRALVPRRLRQQLAGKILKSVVFEPAPGVPPSLAAEIRAAARPHVSALGERLGRDLTSQWGCNSPVTGGFSR